MGFLGLIGRARVFGSCAGTVTVDIFERVAVTDFGGDLYRNIVSLRESVDLFDDLTENPAGRLAGGGRNRNGGQTLHLWRRRADHSSSV